MRQKGGSGREVTSFDSMGDDRGDDLLEDDVRDVGVVLVMGSPKMRRVLTREAWSMRFTFSVSWRMASSFCMMVIRAAASSSLTALFSTRSSCMARSIVSNLQQI